MGALDVAGRSVETPPVALPAGPYRYGAGLGRAVTAQAPGRGRRTPGEAGRCSLRVVLGAEADDRVGHQVAGHEGTGVEGAAQLFGQDDEVDQAVGDAAPLVLSRDQHGGPPERRARCERSAVEDIGLLEDPAHRCERLVFAQEATCRRPQQLLVLGETRSPLLAGPSRARHPPHHTLRSAAAQYSSRR